MKPRTLVVTFVLAVAASAGLCLWLAVGQAMIEMPRPELVLWKAAFAPRAVPSFAIVDDFDGDGLPDVWAVDYGAGGSGQLISGATGAELQRIAVPAASLEIWAFDPGDIDGDGTTELGVLYTELGDRTEYWVGREDGSTAATVSLSFKAKNVNRLGDVDGDGGQDLVATTDPLVRVVAWRASDGAELWEFTVEDVKHLWTLRVLPDTNADELDDVAISLRSAKLAQLIVLSGRDGSLLWKHARPTTGPGTFGHILETCSDRDGDGVRDLWVFTWPKAEIFSSATGARLGTARVEGSGPFVDLDGDGREEEAKTGFRDWKLLGMVDVMSFTVEIETRPRIDLGRVGMGRYPSRGFCVDLDGDAVPDYIDRQPGEVYVLSGAKLLGR